MKYSVLSAEQYYVDKTAVLERELNQFPSVYIEGAAASGKTTAVKMLLNRYEDVIAEVFWMDQETEAPQLFSEKLKTIRTRMEQEHIWVILENMPRKLPEGMAGKIIWLIDSLPESARVILIGREQMEEKFLALLWKQKLELLPQKVLLFTKEEVKDFAEQMGCLRQADEVYKVSGGWAGCAALLLRFLNKDPEKTEQSVKTLRQRYEIDRYVQMEILDTLLPEEQKILRYAGICPWVTEKLCSEILGIADGTKKLMRLEKKGLLLFHDEKKRWKAASLIEYENHPDGPKVEKDFWVSLGNWYEAQKGIEEALYCLKRSGDEMAYRECFIRHYLEVPVFTVLHTDVMDWEDDSWQICYLRGLYCYCMQDFQGLRKEIRYAARGTDSLSEEVCLNLAYMNPEQSLEDWLELLQNYAEKRGPAKLYHMLGDSCSFLCGIRELSGLFNGSRQEVKHKADIWKKCLGESEWLSYLFAQTEYSLETESKDGMKAETIKLIFEETESVHQNIYRARIYLLCKVWQKYPDKRIVAEMEKQKDALRWDWGYCCEDSVEALFNLQLLWVGDQKSLNWWKRSLQRAAMVDIYAENWIVWWCLAKGYLYLNQYERSGEILKNLIPYLQKYQRTYFLSEALFMMSIIKWKDEDKTQALRYVIESFLAAVDFRYAGFYTRYGKNGIEVLENYASWIQHSEPEKWNRKKKYNYGNVLRMPFADYLEVLLRGAKKNWSFYPDMKNDTVEEKLTMMERLVLQDISQGMSNAEICKELNLKLPTVKGHLYSLYKKLGVNSRVQAIVKAKEQGILK